ncbi:MAG: TonB C-terminal domain-containing protein [Xanthomonadaceae bacterium]|jgi:colicin import membrane protein|nr:TonB C-terminal domain-containing protein [Xanthomonadaceae bacterium]
MHADIAERFRPEPEEDGLWGAIALAATLHLLVVLALWVGWKWAPQRSMGAPASGSPMVEASLMISASDIKAAERAIRTSPKPEELPVPVVEEETAPPPQPIPEPHPQDATEPQQHRAQDFIPEPDTVDQDRAARDAISTETAAREQEARHRQSQVDLSAEQRQRLAQIRREREQQQQQITRAQQRLAQLEQAQQRAAAQPQATPSTAQATVGTPGAGGQGGVSDDLLNQYKQAIQQQISSQWRRPDSVPLGQICTVRIQQLPGGNVARVEVMPGCPYDDAGKKSLEAAILRQPLPYRGFENVFQRNLVFNFEAQDL